MKSMHVTSEMLENWENDDPRQVTSRFLKSRDKKPSKSKQSLQQKRRIKFQ